MDDASSIQPDTDASIRRSASNASTKIGGADTSLSRGGTLKKRQSLRQKTSLRRSGSKRSLHAGSIRGVGGDDEEDYDSIFYTPIPTSGNPTDILANRFQAWRKLLKDLITYFREIQASYEQRSRSLLKVSNVLNNTTAPTVFLSEGGLDDAARHLRAFHKHSVAEANKSRDIENDVITQLSGLRSDLNQKIKEIKSLSGDFKNSVDREKDNTRKAVAALHDAIAVADSDPSSASAKNDPFIVRMSVERQVEKQIEEENYLHRAYLNLEGSGRELESIVVGEIQKAYNAYASILKREADSAQRTIEDLRSGPVAIPKDHEWQAFVQNEDQFVNPSVTVRRIEDIRYPGKFNPAAAEIRAGMLERKSKYLKSYTPGWYVLSPTHLHEFKSADHIHTQQPVMSLSLLEQKLGSRSQRDASSHKFSLKGRQSGGMHRGHSWVFRAESWDTMVSWYEDIQSLTEKSGEDRTAFVRKHARSVSGGSRAAPSVSSDGIEDDEADAQPYTAFRQQNETVEAPPKRPEPGGRFPSEVNIHPESSQASPSPSSESSVVGKKEPIEPAPVVAATAVQAPVKSQEETQDQHAAEQPAAAAAYVETIDHAKPRDERTPVPETETNVVDEGPAKVDKNNTMAGATTDVVTGGLVTGASTSEPVAKPAAAEVAAPAESVTAAPSEMEDTSRLHATGHMFPSVLRHESAMTVSELHIPGEWSSNRPSTDR